MFTDAYKGRGVSRFMCKYAFTLFMFLSFGALFYLQKFKLKIIKKKGVFARNYFSSMRLISFVKKSAFFTLNCFSEPKLAKTVLIRILSML